MWKQNYHACMCVCVCIYMYVFMYVRMYVCVWLGMHVCIYLMCVCMYDYFLRKPARTNINVIDAIFPIYMLLFLTFD